MTRWLHLPHRPLSTSAHPLPCCELFLCPMALALPVVQDRSGTTAAHTSVSPLIATVMNSHLKPPTLTSITEYHHYCRC
jgi:hypothetical protein